VKSRTSASGGEAASLTGLGARDADPDRDLAPDDEGEFWTPRTRGAHEADAVDSATSDKPDSSESIGDPDEPDKPGRPEGVDRTGPWFLRSRGRSAWAVALVLLVVAAVYGVCNLAPVRTVLRQSFTQVSSPNPQFYLNGNPWVSGQYLNVPLGIIRQGGHSAMSYKVHVWTVDHAGKTDATTTVTLPTQDGKGAANFKLPIPTDAQLVWAQVEGTSLSVHYRFAGSALPSASATASGSR